MNIIQFESKYTEDLKKLGQLLRNYIVSLETREDDLVLYNTNREIDEYISDFESKKNTILLAKENENIIGYGIGKIKDESWEWTQIKKFWQIEQLFIDPNYRWRWFAQDIIHTFEVIFREQWASHIEISVFSLNTRAHEYYERYGFEERLITLDKKIVL